LSPGRSFISASECTPEVAAEISEAFTYQPWDADQEAAGRQVREALVRAVYTIVNLVPPCPTRTVAIRKLMEARMDCNAAITHRGRY
jgi:hypothetical protein